LELLQHTDSDSPSWMRRLVKDEISFHQTVRVLCDHGLVEPDSNSGELTESCGYSIHKCVHLWTIHVLNKPWDTSLARLAIQFVGSHVPDARGDRPWLTRQRLSQHTARCRYVLNNIVQGEEMIWPCLQLGDMYKQEGKLTDAEWMYERALHDSERACGPENEATLDAVNNLANVFRSQGRLDEAEKMYQRALHGTEKALGPMDSSTLDTVNSLGNLYADQDKLTEAEQMYQRALEGYEKAYGATNTITLDPVNNLGLLYTKQGKFDEAEKMYQRALKGYEEELGPKHTVTLDTFNNLGILYADHGKVVEAEQIYRRVLQGYEETLGEDSMMAHIPALNTLWNIAELSENQGDLENAQTLYTKALLGYNKALGTNHPTSQESQDKVDELDILMKKLAVTEMVEPESKHQEEHQPPLQEAVSKSKRHRLLRKFGLR
jgi:tetratricopeptide (TPR) repeat protein